MIDHVFLWVKDIVRSRAFYETSLEPLGWGEIGTYRSTSEAKDVPDLYGYGDASGASIWLREGDAGQAAAHVGFAATDHAAVDAAYTAAIAGGARDNGSPAIRTYFAPGYYAANVFDFDGNSLEFVHKS